GFIYTGGSDAHVKKISTEGKEVWNYKADDVIHSVAVDPLGNLFTGARNGTVRKIDSNGNSLWIATVVPHINHIAVDDTGSVYAGGAKGTGLVKISSSGEHLWSYTNFDGSVTHITIGPDQNVYASDSAGGITKIESEHGRVIKRFDGFADTLYGSAVDSDGLVYVGTKSGELFCLDFDTDEILWSKQVHSGPLRKIVLSEPKSRESDALAAEFSPPQELETEEIPYLVGTTGPAGGIIAYINPSDDGSWTYLEVALPTWSGAEEDPAYPFGGRGVKVPNLSDAVGSGMANTALIVETLTPLVSKEFAAAICDDLVLGGFDDWFLPSQEEMTLMYENLAVHNIGSFNEDKAYMTSSKGSSIQAQLFNMAEGTTPWGAKSTPFLVRPVRMF
ncbi:MAG: PQQ-binding-like beta-propeller repeat protein, partial [Sphaerochaetaceae bacterium]|nr:PQQ-binding-like beta-propeller repeat protein [Sphaerochaetaceae bacterium]